MIKICSLGEQNIRFMGKLQSIISHKCLLVLSQDKTAISIILLENMRVWVVTVAILSLLKWAQVSLIVSTLP